MLNKIDILLHDETQKELIPQLLAWANQFTYFHLQYPAKFAYPYGEFKKTLAVSNHHLHFGNQPFDDLRNYYDKKTMFFGYLGYDLKNHIEKLSSNKPQSIHMPDIHFFEPELLLEFEEEKLVISSNIYTTPQLHDQWDLIKRHKIIRENTTGYRPITIKHRTPKDIYLNDVNKLIQHIEDGDVYEINYCMEFTANQAVIDPISMYIKLLDQNPSPFSCMLKVRNFYHLGASPERFLKKKGTKLISQPIKGTAARSDNPQKDKANKAALRNSEKERAENLMIVDLVRNDLARSAKTGSVVVEELFGLYSFPKVHQMISTVVAELEEQGIHPIDAIKHAFPMGSMTGAPKIKVMELIEQYEKSKRGLFSGAIGYIDEYGDYDFNVVIRSLLYDAHKQKISFHAGGAITFDSVAEQEYQECMLKAQSLVDLLQNE